VLELLQPKTKKRLRYSDLQYEHAAIAADRRNLLCNTERHRPYRSELLGPNNTSYCGAYWANGFHEDGVRSALAVVKQLQEAPNES